MSLLQGKRIFIVEDNVQNRVVFTMVLQIHGARVEFDRWGRETLSRMRNFPNMDLIILDLMLPNGVTGYQVFDEIRTVPDYAAVPIIAVSAAEPAIALPKTREKGFNGFIAKPVDDELFPKQLARVMAGEKIWSAGAAFQGLYD
jgi:CheY-like chemotaxis protein